MPFGLKNAGVIYQRLVNMMFKDLISRNMEIYVDDMLVKSPSVEQHVEDLQEAFHILRGYGIKLNPQKCFFGLRVGKFLGYLISERGIEANLEKIQAIMDMQPPKTIKEVQRLTDQVIALNRFISRLVNKCLPFFKTFKIASKFKWDFHCQEALEELKKYLMTPPLLVSLCHGKTLLLYLEASDETVAVVLIAERDRQYPVYYVSKVLKEGKINYSHWEKLAFALIIAASKLRQYFQAHLIIVMTDQPLKNILTKVDVAGRLAKWGIELTEFGLDYQPRKVIKA